MFSSLRKKIRDFVGLENLEFLRHSRNYLSATVVQNIFVALSVPLFTHILTPGEYGILSIFASLVTLMTIVFSLDLRSGIVRYYLEKRGDFDRALGSNLIFVSGFSVFSLVFVWLYSDSLSAFFAIDNEVFRYSALVAFLAVFVEIYLSYLQGSKQSKRYSILSVIRTICIISIAVVLILLLAEKNYLGRVYADLLIFGLLAMYAYAALCKLSTFAL